MKRSHCFYAILIVVPILTLTSSVFAQNFGIKGGLNLSNQTQSVYFFNMSGQILNYQVYLSYDYRRMNKLTFSVESGYVRRGYLFKDVTFVDVNGVERGKADLAYNTNYITFSAPVSYKFTRAKAEPYFTIAPVLSYYAGYTRGVRGNLGGYEKQIEEAYDISYGTLYDEFNKIVFGLRVGLGLEVNVLKANPIILEAQYYHDLSYSYNKEVTVTPGFPSADIKIRNYSLEFNIGVKF